MVVQCVALFNCFSSAQVPKIMTATYQRGLIFSTVCGICCIALGVVLVVDNSVVTRIKRTLYKGSSGYKSWLTPVHLDFKFYLFHVDNPDDVIQGAPPLLTERGPYVYSEVLERKVLSIDQETDEILYMTHHMFTFNKKDSGNATEDDEITILNPAYMGTINMLGTFPSDIMEQYGNNIAKLFPPTSVVFVKGKAGDILFRGMKFSCNSKKFKELTMICSTLESSKPPIVIDGPRPGLFLYSFFQKMNNTLRGPFRVKRGLHNIVELGNTTEFRGRRKQKMWMSDECNIVKGTDGITWAPLVEPLSVVDSFIPDICRSLPLYYQRDVHISGMLGSLFTLTSQTWEPEEIECYCPIVDSVTYCLPKGLLDINKCQEIPVILSEPHFLHGDPMLLQFAQGLKPRDTMDGHQSYVVIEPVTGAPLSGIRRTQLNMRLKRHAVQVLENISEGFFPLVWCEEGSTPDISVIADTFQANRLLHLMWFMQIVPLIIGVHILLMSLYLCGIPQRKTRVSAVIVESLVVTPGSFVKRINQSSIKRRGLFK